MNYSAEIAYLLKRLEDRVSDLVVLPTDAKITRTNQRTNNLVSHKIRTSMANAARNVQAQRQVTSAFTNGRIRQGNQTTHVKSFPISIPKPFANRVRNVQSQQRTLTSIPSRPIPALPGMIPASSYRPNRRGVSYENMKRALAEGRVRPDPVKLRRAEALVNNIRRRGGTPKNKWDYYLSNKLYQSGVSSVGPRPAWKP